MPDPTFTEAPAEVPSRAVPSTFSALTDPFLVWEKTFRNELSSSVAWFGEQVTSVSGFASDASESADAAATSAGTASTKATEASDSADEAAASAVLSANAGAAAAGASIWVSEASYTANVSAVVSTVDQQTYRAKTTHSGVATDPSADATNWKVLTIDGSDYLPLAGGVITGPLKTLELQETVVALSGTTPTVDCETGTVFTLSTTGNTTFTFSNPPATGTAYGFTLKLTAGGAHTITWPASVDWAGATAPDAPASGETDVLTFWTHDGGTTWLGFLAGDAVA